MKRSPLLVLCCSALIAGVLAGCGGSDADTTTDGTTSVVLTTETAVSTTATAPVGTTPSAPADPGSSGRGESLAVTFRAGTVTGDTSPSVKRGDRVSISVTSDVADELHLHGYDIARPLTPGQTTTFSFVADIPGKFELELHHNPTRLLTLTVT